MSNARQQCAKSRTVWMKFQLRVRLLKLDGKAIDCCQWHWQQKLHQIISTVWLSRIELVGRLDSVIWA